MSFIPDCRKDENYNYNNLRDEDKRFIDGYDKAYELIEVELDNAIDSDSLIEKLMGIELPESCKSEDCNTVRDFVLTLMNNGMETTRDEIIVSMIDRYED